MEVDMKKFAAVAAAVVFLAGAAPAAFAQSAESDMVVLNVFVERIWPHRLGYVVEYRGTTNTLSRAYLPMYWFLGGDGRAEILALPPGNSWPSMSVFYRDGEFSHLRLHVHRSPSHSTWSSMHMSQDMDSEFENVQGLRLQL
jgi:hypothetical protein